MKIKFISFILILFGLIYSEIKLNFKESFEFGGNISFSAISIDGRVPNAPSFLYIEPTLRYFFTNHFFMGPQMYYDRTKQDYIISKYYGIGLNFGYLINVNKSFYPYVIFGGCFDFSTNTFRHDLESEWFDESDFEGINIPLTMGVKLPISKNLMVNFNSIFRYNIHIEEYLDFLLSIGLTGVIYP